MTSRQEEYLVVLNDEEQYSIWAAHRELPAGWKESGFRGAKDDCLAHIDQVWTDMRPLSLRRQMEAWATNPPPLPEPLPADEAPALVDRLSGQDHRVEIRTRAEDRVAYLQERLELGYVYVHFPDTRGGTELGLKLDSDSAAKAIKQLKVLDDIELDGRLVLDDVPVMCRVRLSPADLAGRGGLTKISE
jgi:uncharacterized protein YbdZ (MbtH family)